jgi:protein SCO1
MRAALVVLVVMLAVGCSDERSYETRGRVIATDLPAGYVVVDHEDIPGLMPAMTMRLRVPDPESLQEIAAGDAISFRLNLNDDSTWVDRIVVLPPDAIEGRPSQPLVNPSAEVVSSMPGDRVPSFSLVDQAGAQVSPETLGSQPYLITFIYTRCPLPDYCPLMTQRFLALQERLEVDGHGTHLISVSVDPEFDTPDVMAEYGSRVGADFDRWTFATGSSLDVSKVATIFGVFYSEEEGEINHNLSTALVGSDGRVRSIWRGNEWSPDEVMETIRRVETVERARSSDPRSESVRAD